MPDNVTLGQLSGSDATERLRETVERLDEETKVQNQKMVDLTRAIYFLTWAMIGLGVVQVVIAIIGLF